MEDQRLNQWIRVLLEPDPEMSKIAADKLGDMGNPAALEPLIQTLNKRTAAVAAAAALALGRIGDSKASPALIQALNHSDTAVQTAAAEALGLLRASNAVPALKKLVSDYLETYRGDRFNLTRGFKRGLFTTAIHSLKQIGTRDALLFAERAERTEGG